MAKLDEVSLERLEEMLAAGARINECYRLLKKSARNIVGQVIEHYGTFYEYDHYPPGDVYDPEIHAQYYYHSHRPEKGEHGHFHTFLRAKGMPKNVKPAPYSGDWERPMGKDALAHIIAISMDGPGFPMTLFTTNRWVTAETFYPAEDVIAMMDRFEIDHVYPCLAVNQWIGAMVRLFRPDIEDLLRQRDQTIADWIDAHPDGDVYEDRDLEVTSAMHVSVPKQITAVRKALQRRKKAA